METLDVGPGKEVELPLRRGAVEVNIIAHGRLPPGRDTGPQGSSDIVDMSSIGSNTNFKPHWLVALRFCSVFCLGCGAELSFVPEMGASFRQNSKSDRITSWIKHTPWCQFRWECESKFCQFLLNGF